jgi:hypothetical protein
VDAEGDVYADDSTASIQVFDGGGTPLSAWPGPMCGLEGCLNQGLAAGPRDSLYVTDTFWRLVVATASLPSDEGGEILLPFGIWGGAGTAPAQFGEHPMQPGPQGVAVGPGGAVYVADNNSDRVQAFSSGGAFSSAFGQAGSGPGQLDNPQGVVAAPSLTVYVADTDNDRVQVFGEQSAPTTPPVPPPNPTPPNATAPRLVGLRTYPARFRPRGTRRRCRRGRCVRAGTTIIFGLNEPASVALTFTRRVGRRSRGVGALTRPGGGGLNRLRFGGRLRGRPLAAGRYVVTARATDRSGVRSNVARRKFRIAR